MFFLIFLIRRGRNYRSQPRGSLLLSAGLISQRMNGNCQSDAALSSETRGDWLPLLCAATHARTHAHTHTHTHTHRHTHAHSPPSSLCVFTPSSFRLYWCATENSQKKKRFFVHHVELSSSSSSSSKDGSHLDFSPLRHLFTVILSL